MKYVVPLLVLAVVVAGFAYYTLFSGPDINAVLVEEVSQPTDTQVTIEPATPERESFAGEDSIYNLLTRGDSLECSITFIPNPVEPDITGTMFTNEGSLRGDFVVPTPDLSGQMVTSIIITDRTVWQWTDIDGDIVGSKQIADYTPAALARLLVPIGLTTPVQYDCLTWPEVDNTIFEAPSTILFTDAANAQFEGGIIFEDGEF